MALDRLVIHIAPDRLTFELPHPDGSTIQAGGPDHPEMTPEELAERIVNGFATDGVDASAELEAITQGIRDYRSSRP